MEVLSIAPLMRLTVRHNSYRCTNLQVWCKKTSTENVQISVKFIFSSRAVDIQNHVSEHNLLLEQIE